MNRLTHNPYLQYPLSMICLILSATVIQADTLYIRDGSVLKGSVSDGVADDMILSNPYFGDVSVLLDDILFQTMDRTNACIESYVITENLDILAVRCKAIPVRQEGSILFNMLVLGEVQSIRDSNGLEVPFDTRSIGDNTLVTIDYDMLSPDTQRLTIITLQQGKIRPTDTGHMVLQLKYIPDKDTSMQVLVKYPKSLKPQMIAPEAYAENEGLIIWEKQLKRQQQFIPEIEFSL